MIFFQLFFAENQSMRVSMEVLVSKQSFLLLLARSLQDVFLLPHIPWIEQGGSLLLVTLLYDLFDALTILS